MILNELVRVLTAIEHECKDWEVVIRIHDNQLSGDSHISEPLVIIDAENATIYIGE